MPKYMKPAERAAGQRHADQRGHQRLEEERQRDVERRGADQPHDADLLAPREGRQPDRVGHQQQGGEHQEGGRAERDPLQHVDRLQDRGDLLAHVADLGDAVEALRRRW